MPLLEVDRITSGYGDTEILSHVSVKVEEREIISVIGPNGAGKSTLMKTIFGLLHPREGTITFDGQDISTYEPHQIVRQRMCYVSQVANVFTTLTVEENLEMGAFVTDGHDLAERKQRVYDMFPKLHERRRQPAGKMSGGERQMVAMGGALMIDPRLVLLDEPSAGLSPKLVDEIFEHILRINDSGIAIMMVEQNAQKSLQMANRGYVLASGENRYEGNAGEMLENPEIGRLYLGG